MSVFYKDNIKEDPLEGSSNDITSSAFSTTEQTYDSPEISHLVTKQLLDNFYQHTQIIKASKPIPKFWDLKNYFKECCSLKLYAGRRAGHTTAGIEFSSQFSKVLFICYTEEQARVVRKSITTTNVTVISASQLDVTVRGQKGFDLFVVDTASMYSSLEFFYEGALFAGNNENTYLVFLG